MANQQWVSLLPQINQTQWGGAGTALSSAATATISPMPAGTDINVPVNQSDWYPGKLIRVTARGFLTTTGTSTTATWFLAMNKGNSGSTYVTLATSAGLTTGTGTLTGLPWKLAGLIRCTAVANSGNTLSTMAEMELETNTTAPTLTTPAVNFTRFALPSASGETAAAVDLSSVQGLALRATLAGANATIQLSQWLVEALN